MRGQAVSSLVSLLSASVCLTAAVSAQERRAPDGAVVVRPVQVREVRVNQPAPPPLHDQRPSFGLPRPVDPAFISRPIPRPQATALPNSRFSNGRFSNGTRGRGRVSDFKPRHNVGFGVVVGYPVIYPYAYPYDPFSPTSGYSPYSVAPPAPNTYSNVDSLPATSSMSLTESHFEIT